MRQYKFTVIANVPDDEQLSVEDARATIETVLDETNMSLYSMQLELQKPEPEPFIGAPRYPWHHIEADCRPE